MTRTVEVDWLVTTAVVPALVWVRVTGQIVVDSSMIIVVIASLCAGEEVVSTPAEVAVDETAAGKELVAAELAGEGEVAGAEDEGTLIKLEVAAVEEVVSTPAEVDDSTTAELAEEVATPAVVDEDATPTGLVEVVSTPAEVEDATPIGLVESVVSTPAEVEDETPTEMAEEVLTSAELVAMGEVRATVEEVTTP